MESSQKGIVGCILGTAIGDALGLPMEGMSARRIQRLYPDITGHALLFGRGMVSDDTEHTVMVARSLLQSKGDLGAFSTSLARHLRCWFLSLPSGLGKATARSCIKLLLGFPPSKSGVFSAGNGPSMRSAIIGLQRNIPDEALAAWVRASTEITHRDPKAFFGAFAVALAARHGSTRKTLSSSDYLSDLEKFLSDVDAEEFLRLVADALSSSQHRTPEEYLQHISLPKGITGYTYHTVPAVLYCFFRHADSYEDGIKEVIRMGGDTDSTAAILGALIGARVGEIDIPAHWKDTLWEWPHSVAALRSLGIALADSVDRETPSRTMSSLAMLIALPRNLFFLLIVLSHGVRRLLPPY